MVHIGNGLIQQGLAGRRNLYNVRSNSKCSLQSLKVDQKLLEVEDLSRVIVSYKFY